MSHLFVPGVSAQHQNTNFLKLNQTKPICVGIYQVIDVTLKLFYIIDL